MAKLALFVTFEVEPGRMTTFLPLIQAHAGRSKANEPGCLRFDVLLPKEGGDQVLLYELYADQAAFDLHAQSAHMARYREETKGMTKPPAVRFAWLQE
ncbi:MAG: antibiotic biosynthesis monooxygenase [Alphaproteobacteria bacterium]|nr:antibiotic biosynthesis monooxygenase [Alphaproteobacteria bacterium]